jgi:long-chain acyl-CoA synthetase
MTTPHQNVEFNPSNPYQGLPGPLDMLYFWEENQPDAICMQQPIEGKWHTLTWRQMADEVRRMATVLQNMNLPAGSRIAILSKNCNYWVMSDLAIMMSGHISVPLYPNLTDTTIRQILEHAEVSAIFVGKLDNFHLMKPGIPEQVRCISYPIYAHAEYENWRDLTNAVEPIAGKPSRQLDELMTIIYTSGTTGVPKGVMHKFQNFAFGATHALRCFPGLDESTKLFSYLPLSHIAERMVVEFIFLYTGGMVSFAESLELFAKNLQQVQPHVFLGVPRIWTKFQLAILEKLPKLNLLLSIPLLGNFLKRKLVHKLGLSQVKYALTGAAPISANLVQWYLKLGIIIQEGYAMTENCAYSHFSMRDKIRYGSVGQSLPHSECKIGPDNEILVKNPCIMNGYYKMPELTAETITPDGFLRTGDTGTIDAEGFLMINGRVKDIFKTDKGKYVSPSPIELELSKNNNIEQVCVVGMGIPQPIALVVLSEAALKLDKASLKQNLENTVRELNPRLDSYERLHAIVVMRDNWTIENGMLTPTLKIKRNELEKIKKDQYYTWYEDQDLAIWE